MALPKNRKAVLAILDEISSDVMGYRPRYFPSLPDDVAIKVVPGGDLFPSDEVFIYSWIVVVRNTKTNSTYTLCLDAFIKYERLEEIFSKHFGSNPTRGNPFELPTRGIDRVVAGYPVAVRIRDNSVLTEFSFDWGRDQETAEVVYKLFNFNCGEMKDVERIAMLIEVLRSISKPVIYAGGPNPQLPFESRWLDNYQSALDTVMDEERVCLGMGMHTEHDVTNIISTTLTFYK